MEWVKHLPWGKYLLMHPNTPVVMFLEYFTFGPLQSNRGMNFGAPNG
jgi:hypothetical protein